jgi:predicted GNAT superfamily acetyltransferase
LCCEICTELEEFRACVALQKEVWGFSDAELVPLRIFSLAPKIGGQVVGAWEGETLIGYAMAIPGSRNGHPYLHSHMVAVKEDTATQDSAAGSNYFSAKMPSRTAMS